MFAQLQLLGSSAVDDPYRVDLPNYSMVDVDYANMSAIVSVGFRDGPPKMPPQGDPLYPFRGDKFVLIGLTPDQLSAWWAALAARYPKRDKPFAPEFP